MEIINQIFEYLQENYNQNDPIPQSGDITVNGVRVHIESASCHAIVACVMYSGIGIAEFSEDDGYICSKKVESYSAGWLKDRTYMYQRMTAYLEENCTPQYYHGHEGDTNCICGYKDWK